MKIALTSDLHMDHTEKTVKYLCSFFDKLNAEYEDVDIVIIAGDLSSIKVNQFEKCLKILRRYWDGLVLVVAGNHDFWNGEAKGHSRWKKYYTFPEIVEIHRKICKDLGVIYLSDNNPWEDKDKRIRIYGFDGWYWSKNPSTNDAYWMPKQTPSGVSPHEYMNAKAFKDLWRIYDSMDLSEKKGDFYKYNILVTHFQPFATEPAYAMHCGNSRWLDEITRRFDYLLCGHTHQELIKTYQDCIILNSGSDYNAPKWKVFNV